MSERSNLRQQQDVEYLQSLTKDQEKENQKRKELQSIQDKVKEEQDLHRARLAKVVHEPDMDEPHVMVSVSHVTLGVRTRRFPFSCLICSIYDWVGSLSPYPAYFTISSCNMPSLVDRALVNMAVADDQFGEMAIFAALHKDCSLIIQIPDNHDMNNAEDIWEVPPILLEEDEL